MKLQDERDTMSDRLQEETEFRKKMADKLSHERHQSQKEKEGTQEVRFTKLNRQHGVKIASIFIIFESVNDFCSPVDILKISRRNFQIFELVFCSSLLKT